MYDRNFVGAHAISQVMLFNLHPTGKMNAAERIDALTAEGRHPSLRQRPELRAGLPKTHPANALHRPMPAAPPRSACSSGSSIAKTCGGYMANVAGDAAF